MEGPDMEQEKNGSHMTSAAAFVEGGIQDACDDACSICLEEFCKSDPSTLTNCKHDFHLQCILEWCQRSSQCPMCWQSISLKDPTSQELLEAVERERNIRLIPQRNSTIFHHPTLGDFELQHLPVGANDSELEERIMQHLAAAAMGRNHHNGRREGQRSRSSAHGRPQYLVFSTHPAAQHSGSVPIHPLQVGGDAEPAAISVASPSIPLIPVGDEQSQAIPHFPSGTTGQISSAARSNVVQSNQPRIFSTNGSSTGSSPQNQDRAGPSDLQSLSESLKSRFNAVSMRYKESLSKGTRGWKERLFSRNTSMADIGSEVRREVNAGFASVSRLMERLETRENRTEDPSATNRVADSSVAEQSNHNAAETSPENSLNDSTKTASCAASSGSS